MKVLHINTFGNLSTGRIASDICRTLRENGHEGMVAFSRNTIDKDIPHFQFGSKWSVYADGVMTRLTDRAGFYSSGPTKQLIRKIKEYDPDIIHLHNLHGYYVNIEMLFNYLKASGKPVVWTLHDCWPFTGHCTHFDYVGCQKWQTGCHDCPQKHEYPKSYLVDNSKWNWEKKRNLFTSLDKMVVVTPSHWLADLVQKSFLQKYPVEVIHNCVDMNVFKPTYGTWVKDHGLENKKIVLGVASKWSRRKGLVDLVKLSSMLPDEYKIVVVGVDDRQLKALPPKILGIKRTYNVKELAEIYTAAHVFVNPTYEDNFPTDNLEALACGTPVITYNTGGSPEVINEQTGKIVVSGNIEALLDVILTINFDSKECIKSMNSFNRIKSYLHYIELYDSF